MAEEDKPEYHHEEVVTEQNPCDQGRWDYVEGNPYEPFRFENYADQRMYRHCYLREHWDHLALIEASRGKYGSS
jgi:hypothetical protein